MFVEAEDRKPVGWPEQPHVTTSVPAARGIADGLRDVVASDVVDPLMAAPATSGDDSLAFQRLVGNVAAALGRVDPDLLDDAIIDGLRQIAEALHIDLAVLWRTSVADGTIVPTHFWIQPPYVTPPESLLVESIPGVITRLDDGETCAFTCPQDLSDPVDQRTFQRLGPRSGVLTPLPPSVDAEGGLRILGIGSIKPQQEWSAAIVEGVRLVAGLVSQAFERRAQYKALQHAIGENRQLRERLAIETVELRREVKVLRSSSSLVVSDSPAIKVTLAQVEQVAPTPATVLLLGETGTGKEVMAQTIHSLSPRHHRQMIRVSCAAIPAALIESELFGRERGAYTGALSRQIGRFEAANQSTLFLDEIGDLPAEVQVKLLRVLQERVIERLGSTQSIKVDVRIIAATNRNLEQAVADKTFREDLFYRLNVFPITVPPLRERPEDIPGLVWSFIDEFSTLFGKPIDSISKDSLRDLQRYPWPGNVRELRNVIERAIIIATGRQLVVSAPRLPNRPVPKTAMTLSALEVEHIRAVLDMTNWRVRGAGGAAERLGLKPTTLEIRMARLGISRARAS
jgi:DNA-binding NtrC family response regulator